MPRSIEALRVAAPCPERWDGMTGDERARRCAKCDIDVHDVTEMTTAEAEALLANRPDRLCIRVTRRKDGTVITKDHGVRWFVPPAQAAAARIVGDDAIAPSADVQRAMRDAGERSVLVVARVYIGVDGDVTDATIARSSGHADYDRDIVAAIRRWRYRPFWRDSLGRAVETMATVSYPLTRA